jgi:hypothetical protein
MGWFTSGSSCRGNLRFECTYEEINPEDIFNPQRWCRDSDSPCVSVDDGGGLISVKDNQSTSSAGGGGW